MNKRSSSDQERIGPYHRLRCACCGCPTLNAPTAEVPDHLLWPQSCLLCDWENAGPGRTEDTDDEIPLDRARANVARFSWMYDPDALPAWLPHRPSSAELQARTTLRQLFAAIDQSENESRRAQIWSNTLEAENRLRSLVEARVEADVSEAEEDDTDTVDAEDDEDNENDEDFYYDVDVAQNSEGHRERVKPVASPPPPATLVSGGGDDRSFGPFDYPGPPRGSAVIAGITSSNADATASAVLRALADQPVLLYGSGYAGDGGAPHVIAVLPANARAGDADAVREFLMKQPGVLGAFIDRRDGA